MDVHVSITGVLVAALSAMVIGAVWYSPALFGKPWMNAIGLTDKEMKKKMGSVMIALIIVSLVTAYVLSLFISYVHNATGDSWMKAALHTSLLAWIGIATTTIFAHGLFEPKDKKVLYINTGNRFVTLLVMGLILSAFLK